MITHESTQKSTHLSCSFAEICLPQHKQGRHSPAAVFCHFGAFHLPLHLEATRIRLGSKSEGMGGAEGPSWPPAPRSLKGTRLQRACHHLALCAASPLSSPPRWLPGTPRDFGAPAQAETRTTPGTRLDPTRPPLAARHPAGPNPTIACGQLSKMHGFPGPAARLLSHALGCCAGPCPSTYGVATWIPAVQSHPR